MGTTGENIKTFMDDKGITTTLMAKRVNKSYSHIRSIIRGDIEPAPNTLFKICEILNIDASLVLNGKKIVGKKMDITLNGKSYVQSQMHVSLTDMAHISGDLEASKLFYKQHVATWGVKDKLAFQNWLNITKKNL